MVKPERINIKNIIVFGAGAAGSNTLLHLIYALPALDYSVIDFDTIEVRNYEAGTQPYSKTDLNRPKTQALQRIAILNKNKRINAINMKILSTKDIIDLVKDPKSTILIDAFDNAESRNLFIPLGKKYNVIHIGFSAALGGEAVWDDTFLEMQKSKADTAIDVCEMTMARPFIFALTSLAAMNILTYIETGIKNNLYFDKYFIMKKY